MDWTTIIIAIIGSGIGGSIVAGWYSRQDTQATTYEKLSNTVERLQESLDQEIASRHSDRELYDRKIKSLEAECINKIADLRQNHEKELADLNKRLKELEKERQTLIMKNHELRKKLGENG